ncbi:uncharacterized protein LOC116853267 [Odontomachus brunneus]|uniref:uncharacterized protein LOC116853267 n=1 Tax=Odontomachus brunneus TaxID=486640 RepID=UPI0013F1AE81|nr:uncharacterized protein LOC116853267 [Odontomachus brunneus]
MATVLLQANLNHARRAQDLLWHTMAERDSGLAVATEPHHIPPPNDPRWMGRPGNPGMMGNLAIIRRYSKNSPPACCVHAGGKIVAVEWGSMAVVGVYASSALSLAEFEDLLDGVREVIRTKCLTRPVLLAGDFNAKSKLWCSPRANAKGETLAGWAAGLGLCLLNRGYVSTCVRPQEVVLVATPREVLARRQVLEDTRPKRWALTRLNTDELKAAVLAATWDQEECDLLTWEDIEKSVTNLRALMESRPSVYEGASSLRGGPEMPQEQQLHRANTVPRDSPCAQRLGTRRTGPGRVLGDLDRHPWGRSYHIVRNKLKPWSPPLTEEMDPQRVEEIVETLFPGHNYILPPYEGPPAEWHDELGVTVAEITRVAKRLGGKKALGPNGVPRVVWALSLGSRLRQLFSCCFRAVVFPQRWKEAKLVLLHKVGKPVELPSAYRPICLLDEVGKMLERIIADRLVRQLRGGSPDLSEAQFGFREDKSTVDAIRQVRALVEQRVAEGGGVDGAVARHRQRV